jgi:hypothetical protein
LIYDYEPANVAEMEAVAGALVENLMARGRPVVAVSTRPSGPLLADRMFSQIGNRYEAQNGLSYLNLGYLSGGPTAMQLFAASPDEAPLTGFRLPKDLEGGTSFDTPILQGVDEVSDFSMVAVLTAGTGSARQWTEQIQPHMDGSPFVMVSSAGVEPMIRPYYEAREPQVEAILAGIPSAAIFENNNGKPGTAMKHWDAYGSGVLLAALALIIGSFLGVGKWLLPLTRRG